MMVLPLLPNCHKLTVENCTWSCQSLRRGSNYAPAQPPNLIPARYWSAITIRGVVALDNDPLIDVETWSTEIRKLTVHGVALKGHPRRRVGGDGIPQQTIARAATCPTHLKVHNYTTDLFLEYVTRNPGLAPPLLVPVPRDVVVGCLTSLRPEYVNLAQVHINRWSATLEELHLTCLPTLWDIKSMTPGEYHPRTHGVVLT